MSEEKEREISVAEEKARNDGWVPKDEWTEAGNDEDSWVNYNEFNFRGELMDRIKSQTRNIRSRDSDISDLKVAIRELADHNRKIAESEYKRAIRDLKQQKVAAAREENHEVVAELEDQIDDLKEKQTELKNQGNGQQSSDNGAGTPPQEFIDWVNDSKNSWYKTDHVMQAAATAIVGEYERNNSGASPSDILEHLESKIVEEFPHKFSKTLSRKSKVNEPGANGSGSGVGTKNKKYTKADLSEEQLSIAKTFEAQGALSLQEYVDQLAELGELASQKGT